MPVSRNEGELSSENTRIAHARCNYPFEIPAAWQKYVSTSQNQEWNVKVELPALKTIINWSDSWETLRATISLHLPRVNDSALMTKYSFQLIIFPCLRMVWLGSWATISSSPAAPEPSTPRGSLSCPAASTWTCTSRDPASELRPSMIFIRWGITIGLCHANKKY